MIVLGIKLDGIYGFDDFEISFSYPKKIKNSIIKEEHLKGRERFRYKKAIILMGANATGKTCLGKSLLSIFNFLQYRNPSSIIDGISKEKAFFSIDFVNEDNILRRFECRIENSKRCFMQEYTAQIDINDSYEMAVKKLSIVPTNDEDLIKQSFSIFVMNGKLNYHFVFPETHGSQKTELINQDNLLKTLRYVLGTLDPTLSDVAIANDLQNSFIIKRNGQEIIIQDGKLLNEDILSSGTKEGINIALLLASMMDNVPGFYYCDEHFSYIHSDIEKRIFGIMLDHLPANSQLVFTTHNTDMLDLNLPKHTYMFLRKRKEEGRFKVESISGSDFLKRNTDSMRSAVENDVFSSLPDDSLLDELEKEWIDE